MEGKNSHGRRISLLNAHDDTTPTTTTHSHLASKCARTQPPPPLSTRNYSYSSVSSYDSPASSLRAYSTNSVPRLPLTLSHSRPQQSRSSSSDSTPCLSPQTPALIRSDSCDSTAMQTPSPITPDFGYVDPITAQQQQGAYLSNDFAYPKDAYSQFTNQLQQQPMPPMNQAYAQNATAYYPAPPSTDSQPAQQPAQKSKKNQYPCPVAKQYNCSDHFTTSGHAARHAKKHTGKKDSICPDCNKAFTRKDNMEQHRRTHQNGRGVSKNGVEDKSRKVQKQMARRPKPAPLQAAAQQPLPTSALDPSLATLPASPSSTFNNLTSGTQQDLFGADFTQRSMYPDPSACTINPHMNSPSFGLDTLAAAAASGATKRDYME